MPSETAPTASSARVVTLAANASFVPIGVVTVLLSPMLPMLSARWSLDYAQAGTLFTAQFLASTVAVSLSGLLVARYGFRFAINAGLLLTAASTAMLLAGSRTVGTVCIAGYGAGSGLAVPAANLLVAELNPKRSSSALNVLNFSWSAGAVVCPFLVAAAEKAHLLGLLLECIAGFSLLVMIWIAFLRFGTSETAARKIAERKKVDADWPRRSLPALIALFFLYVGTESAFGGWLASYATSLKTMPPVVAVMTPAFFYASLMVGRLLAPAALGKVDEVRLVRIGLLLACAGMAGVARSHHVAAIAVSASAAGLGLSSVYPITIAFLSREFGTAAARVGSLAFMMSNLGGACLPWLVGVCSTHFGKLGIGLSIPLLGSVAMLALYLPAWWSTTPEVI